ncbi:MAG TPA: serine/threonine-protein kinase, partial [Thermoanaerobaculia bacterium]
MSSVEPLGPYRLGERVGSSVWIAEDTRNGKRVALKLLTKQLPKDQAKRDALIRDVRVSAALYHAFLVPILEIAAIGDNLVMVMDFVEGETVSKHVRNRPLESPQFFRLAYQLAEAVKYLHMKGVTHGNITGDAVLVGANGQVRLGGLNLGNMLQREGAGSFYQQKGNDPRSVAYMSPEQITSQAVDQRTDIFSAGLVMYEMATGRQTYIAPNAVEIARMIVEAQPQSPKAVHPAIDNHVLAILGRCLYKDAFKRLRDGKELADTIGRADESAIRHANELATKVISSAPSVESAGRKSILLL